MARVAAQYTYMVSSDFEARYALGPYTPVDPGGVDLHVLVENTTHLSNKLNYIVHPFCTPFLKNYGRIMAKSQQA